AAPRFDRGDGLPQRPGQWCPGLGVEGPRRDRDRGAFGGEPSGDSGTDAPARARDERDPAVELTHPGLFDRPLVVRATERALVERAPLGDVGLALTRRGVDG